MADFEQVGVIAVVRDYEKFNRQLATMSSNIVGMGGTASGAAGGIGVMNAAMSATVAVAAAAAAAAAALAIAVGKISVESVKVSISVESAFAGVAKTTDGLVDDFGNMTTAGEEMKQEFRDLAKVVPTSIEELMAIGEIAGQLGVPQKAIVGFTETIAQLGMTTNMTEEVAADSLARMANIYQISADSMSENTARVGAAVVALGNKFAASESEIVDFATRIAGAGKVAGLSQADILGIGTAMASVGVEAEAGGTAVQKVLLDMNKATIMNTKDLAVYAKTSGMTASEFKTAWEEDAGGAFTAFVDGLGAQGDMAMQTLSDLGLEDQRLIRAFLSLSGAGDLLANSMNQGNIAFEENTALTKEAGIRSKTTESQIELLKNKFRDLGLSIGDTIKESKPFQDALAWMDEKIAQLSETYQKAIWSFQAAGFAGLANLFGLPPEVVGAIDSVQGKIKEVMDIISGGGGVTDVLSALGLSDEKIGIIQTFGETATQVFGDIATALGGLGGEGSTFLVEQFTKISDWVDENGEDINAFIKLMGDNFSALIEQVAGLWPVIEPLLNGIINIVLGIAELVMAVSEGDWATAWEAIKTIVVDAFLALFESFGAFTEWVLSWFDTDWATLSSVWQSDWDQLVLIVTTVFTNMWISIVTWLTMVWTSISEFFVTTMATWQSNWDLIKLTVETVFGNIVTAISEKINEILTNITTKFAEIVTFLNLKVTEFFTLGQNLIQGLIGGIADKAAALVQTIKDNVNAAISAAKDLLGIKSPSRVFFDIGENMMLGLQQGIDSLSNTPVDATINAINKTVAPALQLASSVPSSSVQNTYNYNMSPTYQNSQSPTSLVDDMRLLAAIT